MSSGSLCVLFVLLVMVAAFGHLMWVTAAAILNALFGPAATGDGVRNEDRPARRFDVCPVCDAGLDDRDRRCPDCSLGLDTRLAHDLDRLRVAQREVRGLVNRGQLDRDEATAVLDQLEDRTRSLRGLPPRTAERPRATPVIKPPEPPTEPVAPVASAPLDIAELVPAPAAGPEPATEPTPPAATHEPPLFTPAVAAALSADAAPPEPLPATAARTNVEPLDLPPPEPPPPKRRGSFLEEHNILWGELVGGLLIVGCSVALLVTLWRQLEEIRYFPFALSAGVTLALFGAGQYTLHRWKLAGTSRGMLVISMLLTPITMLLLSEPVAHGAGDAFDIGVKLIAVAAFVGVVRTGGRDLIGTSHLPGPVDRRWLLSLAVVGAAGTQLLPASMSTAWLPLACFLVAVGATLGGLTWYHPGRRDEPISDNSGTALLMFVGLAAFALFAAWGLFLVRPPVDFDARRHELAVPLALTSLLVIEAGVLVLRRVSAAGLRTTGTAVALVGFVGVTAALALAWPAAPALVLVSAASGAYLTFAAFRERLVWVQAGALPLLAFAAVVGFHAFGTAPPYTSEWLGARLDSSESGAVLVGFALALGGIAELLALRASLQTAGYAIGGLSVGALGLALVSVHGVDRPIVAAVAHAAAAVGLLAANVRYTRPSIAHGGLWLVLVATLWAMWAAAPNRLDRWGFALAVEALVLAAGAVWLRGTRGPATALLRRAARDVSFAASVLAVLLAASTFRAGSDWHSGTLFALALTGAALARLTGAAALTWAGSVAALLGLVHLALVVIGGEPQALALEAAILAHVTLAATAAVVTRRQVRVFARPLYDSARVSSALAIPLLFFAPPGHAFVTAALALWLAIAWLAFALWWRERGAFSAFQAAVTLAALLVAFGWVELQPWREATAHPLGDPRALHAFGLALSALSIAWALARRAASPLPRARDLWCDDPLSLERFVLGGTVVGALLLVAVAVALATRLEFTAITSLHSPAPADLAHAFEPSAWWVLGALAAAVTLSWRLSRLERDAAPHAVGLALLFLAAPVLWAGTHAHDLATASALRWGLAFAFVGGSAAVALRIPARRGLEIAGFPTEPTPGLRPTLLALLAVAAGGVLVLSAKVAELGFARETPAGPLAHSVFATMGALPSNLAPLALVVCGLALTAARERSGGYALSGGLVFVVTLAAGYALSVVVAGGALDGAVQTRLYLIASAATAVWALAWLASEWRVPGGAPLAVQVSLGFAVLGLLCGLTAARVIDTPHLSLSESVTPLAWHGWTVLVLVAGAGFWHARRAKPDLYPLVFGYVALAVGVLLAAAVRAEDGPPWLSFHVLALTWAVLGFVLLLLPNSRTANSVLVSFALLLVACALRGGWYDPWRPWVPSGLAVCAAVLFGAVALRRRANDVALLSGLAVNLAAVFVWLAHGPDSLTGFLLANAAGVGAAAAVWTLVRIRTSSDWLRSFDLAPLVALALLGVGLLPAFGSERPNPAALNWLATAAVVLGCGVGLWDRSAALARPGLYAAGALAALLVAAAIDVRPMWNAPAAPLALAVFALTACVSAYFLARCAAPLRIPERGDGWPWLPPATLAVGALALGFGLNVGLNSPDVLQRLALPVSVMLLALAPAALVTVYPPALRESLQAVSVALGYATLGALALALPEPDAPFVWLTRNAWLFVALAFAAVAGTEGAPHVGTDWLRARKRVAGCAAALALGVLCVNLFQQVPVYDPNPDVRRTPLSREAALGMLAAIAALFVLALRFALKPDRDPLGLPEHRRTAYVYLAEVLIVLFFTQIRFNVPELFLGELAKLWTFVVMALAYAGIGLAELFERKKVDVLAVPLRRTGVLLPLIPLLAFWLKPPGFVTEFAETSAAGLGPLLGYLQKLPQHFDTYAWLWFLAGGVYGLLALKRKSFGWALLAALATNFAMWSLLAHHQVPFAVHPQAWVIPLALIVLASEHINRSRLTEEASNAMRYTGVAMIYVASAADLFIAGVGESVWLPVILAILCVAGVVAGIALRVRAFIYLGVGFLLLDVFAMIWHAAVNLEQTWVWYASGIVLGVLVLALFAYLEKRRTHDERPG